MGAGWGEIDAQNHKNGNGLCDLSNMGCLPPDGAIVRCGPT